jgi:hypothetical protein
MIADLGCGLKMLDAGRGKTATVLIIPEISFTFTPYAFKTPHYLLLFYENL